MPQFLRHLAATIAAALALVGLAAAPASAADPVVTVTSPLAGATLSGVVTVGVDVSVGDFDGVYLTVGVGSHLLNLDVPLASCSGTCHRDIPVDLGEFLDPAPGGPLAVVVNSFGYLGDGSSTAEVSTRVDTTYVAAADPAGIGSFTPTVTSATPGYLAGTSDSTAVLLATSATARGVGESAEVRVFKSDVQGTLLSGALASASAPWAAGSTPTASATVDVSSLNPGWYVAELRPRSAAGGYGVGSRVRFAVAHVVAATTVPPAAVAEGASVPLTAVVRGPLAATVTPAAVMVSADGGAAVTLPTPDWSAVNLTVPGATSTATLAAGLGLAAGIHTLSVQVLDATGAALGAPTVSTLRVVSLGLTVTGGPLYVGVPTTLTLRGTAPTGSTLGGCTATLADPAGTGPAFSWCSGTTQSVATARSWTPTKAGAGSATLSASTSVLGATVAQSRTVPLTVYARRLVALSAPSAVYGARTTLTATVSDTAVVGASVRRAGATVTFEQLVAGTTTWTRLGSATTSASGVATLAVTVAANATVRARVAGTAPGTTVSSPNVSRLCRAALAWVSAPTSARHSSTVTLRMSARPYEPGAKAVLQVRKGAGAWTSVRTVLVSSTAEARFSYAFPAAGAWTVRVVRLGTTRITATVSSVRAVTVS